MTGSLFHYPRLRAVNSAGDPVPGARLYAYRAGTSVLAETYTTSSLTVAHSNPQTANAAGEFAAIYLDPDAGYDYKFVCQNSEGAQLWAEDNVPAGVASTGGGGDTTTGPPGLSVAEVKIYRRSATAPATPTGGSFNFTTQSLSAPADWSATIPAGYEPIYVSTAVAAVEGPSGTDALLEWSAPVILAQDGSSVDIVFRRSATQPATPAPSPSTPAGWYTDVGSVPASADKLWSSVGTRDNASQNWVWQVPIQVEGNTGPAGADASLYYIKPDGTAIKNGSGQIRLEARQVFGGNDVLLSTGTIQLYVGSTLVTAANGYVAGSNGYVGIFDSGDIAGSVVVTLRNGPSGNTYDSITLVDVADGEADTGKNAVYGYIEASGGLAWVRASDQTTWTPSGTTTRLDCTFVQNGAEVAKVGWLITRSSAGILTGAVTTHGAGDLNSSRITVTEVNEGTQAMTVRFAYSYLGDVCTVAETVITSMAGSKGDPGDQGDPGVDGDDGMAVAELAIYKRDTSAPSTPTGGSYDFDTLTLTPPSGWTSEIPSGYNPVYASRAVASVPGSSGVDSSLTWSAPVLALSNGASLDIIFKRSATQPATPADSSGVPAGWFSDVASATGSDILWSSVGTRENADQNWVWQTPIQVEGSQGDPGNDGADAVLHYIRPTNGTAIKNSSGTLTVQARKVTGGTDSLLSTGTIKLYVGATEVTVANGFATGSDGYTGVFDSGDIGGAVTVTLKDGSGGTALDTITLVDVADGTADTGADSVYGYVEANGPLAWVRAADQTTWTPAGTTLQMDCTFVQGGAEVARTAALVTRASDGTLTATGATHSGGDLNASRVTQTVLGSGTQVLSVKFDYSYGGDESSVAETVLTSLAGSNGTGTPGTPATSMTLTKLAIPLFAYQNGLVPSYATANGQATMWSGATDVTASTTFSIAASSNVTGATVNTATNVPISGQPRGYYQITALNSDTGSITVRGVYGGQTIDQVVTFSKSYAGYEIVASLPVSNLFSGRVVYLTTDGKLYRYTGSSWTRAVDGADILANSILSNSIAAGQITAAQMNVTQLSAISANAGTITAGVLQSSSGGVRHDLNNARVIYNSAPGQTGGTVRVQGGGFGPSSNYLDWYGPKPAGQTTDSGIVANLTDAAAIYYLKITGESKSATQRIRGEFEPKAWGCINADTTPATINDRYNIASVTKPAAGQTQVTFAEPLANANYACVTGAYDVTKDVVCMVYAQTTTSVTFRTVTRGNGSNTYPTRLNFVILGSNVPGGSNVTQPSGGTSGGTTGWGNLPSNYVLP